MEFSTKDIARLKVSLSWVTSDTVYYALLSVFLFVKKNNIIKIFNKKIEFHWNSDSKLAQWGNQTNLL